MALQTLQNPMRLAVIALLALGLAACSSMSESGREGGGGEGAGEHAGSASEGSGEHGAGGEGSEGGGEEAATQFDPGDTFDTVRKGARLVLKYDAASETFKGEVTNTTDATLKSVRVEVHMRSGMQVIELGPTKPMDLAPGQTITVRLPAPGQMVDSWGAHAEVGPSMSGGEGSEQHAGDGGGSESMLEFGDWAVLHDNMGTLRIDSQLHGLSAWYTPEGPMLTPAAPEHQPTMEATWRGEWFGSHGPNPAGLSSGAANVTVTLGSTTEADLTLENVPTLGTLQWNDMRVADGRFMGSTSASPGSFDAVGQFGGASQVGVVGHATGPDFRSVFYGNKD